MPARRYTARALATAFLAGRLEIDELADRASDLFGKRYRWVRPLARRIIATYKVQSPPTVRCLISFLMEDEGFLRATGRYELRLANVLTGAPPMLPQPAAALWRVPAIGTAGELADWLRVTSRELDWFADSRSLERSVENERLRHYRYRVLSKRFGSVRLIEAPKPRLKAIQRQIQREILDRVPPHEAAHGFRCGRSVTTFAALHVGRRVVVKLDLEDFFPSVYPPRVRCLFKTVGYPEGIANLLTSLCCNAVPMGVLRTAMPTPSGSRGRYVLARYSRPHLPQGAPTSPSIANLCAYRLDSRLSAMARSAGAIYTRYADDLAFSGDEAFLRSAPRFKAHVAAIAIEEGFAVNHYKTRVMRQAVSQRLAGVVVNRSLSVPREERDRLKATLTNCVRHGAGAQNLSQHADFRAYLNGRIAQVEHVNPSQGKKLRTIYDQIHW